jgi:XTP/dITP diphosphohydrolase
VKIYFVTTNTFKIAELYDFRATAPREAAHIEIVPFSDKSAEPLERDIDEIVTHKALDAYERLVQPCVVEHSGLFLDALRDLPGVLGQIIWESIGDRMCAFLRDSDSRAATARSVIAYCDGKRVKVFSGETRGHVADRARGDYAFHWDPIFIPDGSDRTYGEMGLAAKRATSPVHKAWAKVLAALVAEHRNV